MSLKVNDKFPTDIEPRYIPYTKEKELIIACAEPIGFDLAKQLPGKKIIITAAPGAFTPTCTEQHIPSYLKHLNDFKAKGIDRIIVLTANDPFVNSAWAKALGYRDEENYVVFATDPLAQISAKLGQAYVADLSDAGLGIRTARYVAIVDDGKIKYLANEDNLGFTEVSDPKTILERLQGAKGS